jgi:hypothetical protein
MQQAAARFGEMLVELGLYTTAWCLIHEVFYRFVRHPHSVTSLGDKEDVEKKKDKIFTTYVSYYPALLHAPVTTMLSLVCLYYYGVRYGDETQYLEYWPIKYSASFFLHDTIYGIAFKYNDRVVLAHHVVVILVLCYSWYLGMYGSDLCNGLAQGEITNPLYAVYDIMTHMGYLEAQIRPLGIIFLASFILVRMGVSPWAMWQMQHGEADIVFKMIYTGMWTISMMLIWMMFNKISKLLSQVRRTHPGLPS